MVNQLLQGDTFDVLEQRAKWSRIRGDYDGYEGWIDNKQWKDSSKFQIPSSNADAAMGCKPQASAIGTGNLEIGASPSAIALERYLDAPYLWGGRTIMGIDCSGLTQVCFKACGIKLLRDASQQATQGKDVPSLSMAQRDDLCFFGNSEGDIIHVGIYLGDGRIIHASGQVRVDPIDSIGIHHEGSPEYTHSLCAIRRIITV